MIELIDADYQHYQSEILSIRETVFVREQHVPVELEVDELDPLSRHLLLFVNGQPVGTGRLTPAGHIGRLAVLKPFRNKGYGRHLMKQLEQIAIETGLFTVKLAAQTQAVQFYEQLGYQAYGDHFIDAGITHRMMQKRLAGH